MPGQPNREKDFLRAGVDAAIGLASEDGGSVPALRAPDYQSTQG